MSKEDRPIRDTQISISIDAELLGLIDDLAWKSRMSRSEYIYAILDGGRNNFKRLNKLMGFFDKSEKDDKTMDIFGESGSRETPA